MLDTEPKVAPWLVPPRSYPHSSRRCPWRSVSFGFAPATPGRLDAILSAVGTVEPLLRVAPAGAAKTRKEAAEKLTAAMADASKGITADGGPKTVGAFLTSWLENSVRGSVRKSTYDRNESLCRVHLIPALGRKKLKTLSAADVAGFYRSRLDAGCSAASVHKMHETLHKALKQAVRWGYMTKNPADDVDAPRVHTRGSPPAHPRRGA